MGNIPGKDFEAVIGCTVCFPDGAPKYINLTLAGIQSCPGEPAPPNGTVLLTHTGGCNWGKLGPPTQFSVIMHNVGPPPNTSSIVVIRNADGKTWFVSVENICVLNHPNSLLLGDCGGNKIGHDGTAEVSWGPGIHP